MIAATVSLRRWLTPSGSPPCALIVQHSDRLARGDAKQARHLIEIVLWAIKHEIELLSVQDPEILAGGDMALLLGAVGGMRNHQDSKRKSTAVAGGIRRRAVERRQFVGGRRPYGYRHRDMTDAGRGTGPLVIDPAEAAIVRRIFAEWNAGRSQSQIARDLQHDGVPTLTPTGSWYATTVAGMLKNPVYIGMVVLKGESHPGEHESIIDTETWKEACDLRAARHARPEGGYKKSGRWTAGRHLLTEGLLRCTCGVAMSPVTKKDKRAANRQGYEAYVCLKRLHHGPDACSQRPIKREVVDSAVYSYFERVALDENAARNAFRQNASRLLDAEHAQLAQAERELAKSEARLARVKRGWQDGVIDDAEYAQQRSELCSERAAAHAQAEQHRRRLIEIEKALAAVDVEKAVAAELTKLRQAVAGDVLNGGESGVAPLRATLRRLFSGFQLADLDRPTTWYGTDSLRGNPWVPPKGGEDPLRVGGSLFLIAYVAPAAVDLDREHPVGFPGVQVAGDLFHSNLCSFFADW